MKNTIRVLYISIFFLLNACNAQNSIKSGIAYRHISISSDTTLSYAFYQPTKNSDEHPIAFLFFDPHGSGDFPISLYKNLAEKYGITLIGNNNSSNTTDFSLISSNLSVLLKEVEATYHLEEKNIAFWGFSGGAKAALYNAGLNNTIDYCIYGGSAMTLDNNKTQLLGFNGKQDMNYTDLLNFYAAEKNNAIHFQIEFSGKHAWPDTATAEDAFRWLLLKKMQKKEHPQNKKLINETYITFKKQVQKLILQKQYIDAYLCCNKSIHFLQSLTDISYFTSEKSTIAALPAFKIEVQNLQKIFEKETSIKSAYQTNFLVKDTIYWKKEISDLRQKSKVDKSGICQRLLGFLSLASYSYATRAFQSNDINSLERILFIYQHSDPTNAEQAFMRAKLYIQKNELVQAKTALQEAIQLGIDKSRIEQDAQLKKLE